MNGQDKVLDHTREQLSALFDNELALDEARFLERRLQHDAALAGCVSRWQAIGDAMRGQACALAPAGFSDRVALAVAAEAGPVAAPRAEGRMRRAWMPGAALAASVALVALFATRQVADAPDGQAPAAQVAQAAVPDGLATPAPATPAQSPRPPAPQAPAPAAAQLAAAVAVAEVPRRAAATRRASVGSRGQSQRAAATRVSRAAEAQPQFAVAAATPSNSSALQAAVARQNPFAPAEAAQRAVVSRPWPRALLPNASAGTFNVGYGSVQPAVPQDAGETFHPFRPRIVTAPPESSAR
jgi:negative regulator of sigma E activity